MKRLLLSMATALLCMYASNTWAGGPVFVNIINVTNASCTGINNGSAEASPTGGTAPYTYSWSPSGGTSNIATNLAPGTYTVTVTDDLAQSATATVTIGQNNPLLITTDAMSDFMGYNISCFGGNNGFINTSTSGGVSLTDSMSFVYTGNQQIFVVPAGITSVRIKAWGAQGGANWVNNTNFGGYATGDLAVTPGETLFVYVGQQPNGITGGYNGGGNGEGAGQAGGGASDVRQGGNTLNDRKIVGSAGGGAGYWSNLHVVGGIGGGLTGGDGYREPDYVSNPGGRGATQNAGGTDGTCVSFNNPATAGSFGQGGSPSGCGCEGYGGGGGWYGGAGSGNCRGGGGGSSYIGGVTDSATVGGINIGNGKVTIVYAVSITGYTYSWSNAANTDDISGLTAGAYILNVTSTSGCTAVDTFNITQPAQLSATTNTTNISCYNGNNASITVIPTGGVAGYSYTWNPSAANSSTNSGLSSGNYSVTITDTLGCTFDTSVTITQPAQLSATLNITDVSCFGGNNGSIQVTPTGGTPGYSYNWNPAASNNSTNSALTVGTYSVTITDTLGCTFDTSATIISPDSMTITAVITNETFGNDGEINLTITGGNSPYTFDWSNNATTEDISGIAGGTYDVEVTDGNDCTQSLTVVVGSTLSMIENSDNDLNIYPNPSEGIFNLALENISGGNYDLIVTDMTGKAVFTKAGTYNGSNLIIDGKGWVSGNYIVKLTMNNHHFIRKVMVK